MGGLISALAIAAAMPAKAAIVTLDFDSASTGSGLLSGPLVTGLGTITASSTNSVLSIFGNAITGLSGNFLHHAQSIDSDYAQLAFSFDVASVTFKWTGYLAGAFTAQALDAAFNIVDSFYDSDTKADIPGGPTTLSGSGIRYLRFGDFPGGVLQSGIDDVVITGRVPEPATLALVGLSLAGLAGVGRRKQQAGAAI